MIRIQLLGVPSPRIADIGSVGQLGRPGLLLASYLFTFIGKTFRREFLQELFWPDLQTERANAAMNTALWRIRKLLATVQEGDNAKNLVVHNAEITLTPAGRLLIDTHLFADEVRRLLAGPGAAEATVVQLQSCAEIYAGEFLAGESADWVVAERERLERMYLGLLTLLAKRLSAAGRLDEVISVANQIIAIDPFREATHRDLMIALALNNQRGSAIRHFERLRSLLRKELGLAPTREIATLVETLRDDNFRDRIKPLQSSCFHSSSRLQ